MSYLLQPRLLLLRSPISIVTSLRVNKPLIIPRRRIHFPQGTERMTALTWWYDYDITICKKLIALVCYIEFQFKQFLMLVSRYLKMT